MIVDEGRSNYLHSSLTYATHGTANEQEPKRVRKLGEAAKEHCQAPDSKAKGHQLERLERVHSMAEADNANGIERDVGRSEVADVHGLVFDVHIVGGVHEGPELCARRQAVAEEARQQTHMAE